LSESEQAWQIPRSKNMIPRIALVNKAIPSIESFTVNGLFMVKVEPINNGVTCHLRRHIPALVRPSLAILGFLIRAQRSEPCSEIIQGAI
jgi:hypothetical protein